MFPSKQSFEARDLPVFQREHRLVDEPELIVFQRVPHADLLLLALDRLLVHLVIEQLEPGLPARLGPVHCGICVSEHVLRAASGALAQRDTDAHGGKYLASPKPKRRLELFLDTLGNTRRVAAVHDVLEQDAELVAGQARHHVSGSQASHQPLGDAHEEVVPGRMSEAVVDQLEGVDVQEHDRKLVLLAALHPSDRSLEEVREKRPIRQVGERIVQSVTRKLLLYVLAVRRVRQRACYAMRLAIIILDCDSTHQDPPVRAVLVAHAMLVLEMLRPTLQVIVELAPHALEIFLVHQVQPGFYPWLKLGCLVPEDRLPAVGVVDLAGIHVPVPQPVIRAARRQRVPLLAFA